MARKLGNCFCISYYRQTQVHIIMAESKQEQNSGIDYWIRCVGVIKQNIFQ